MTLADLNPPLIWRHFETLTRIPRGSGNEAAVAAHLQAWAQARGWETARDRTGNLLIRVPATPGREGVALTVLQGHLDMVCEKNADVDFDFAAEGIRTVVEGGVVRAQGTTLGADNGIGVAAALAVAEDPDAVHGPLEILLTIDEETGMTGAFGLEPGFLRGRRMLNLDTEEIGSIYVGCAGGGDVTARWSFDLEPRPDAAFHRIEVKGLVGGHSGLDIHENRANAIKCLARVLDRLDAEGVGYRLSRVSGGSKRNAIPREAGAGGCVDAEQAPLLLEVVAAVEAELHAEFGATDPDLRVEVVPRPDCQCAGVLSRRDARRLVRALLATPSGVVAMSRDVPGLVETSNNLGVVEWDAGQVKIVCCSRSSVSSALEAVRAGLVALYDLAGAEVELDEAYPGWKPDFASPLLATAQRVHAGLFGAKARVKAVHAGLECGLVGERYPGLDMVSIGPDIHGAHSPAERLDIETVGRFYEHLKGILAAL